MTAPIDELGLLDSEFGFLAALIALLKIKDHDKPIQNSKRIIVDARQTMALIELFCSTKYKQEKVRLRHQNKPEFFLFERAVEPKIFGGFTKPVFGPLVPEFITEIPQYKPATRDYEVTKTKKCDEPVFLDIILKYLKQRTGIQRCTLDDPEEREFYNNKRFTKSAESTCEIHDILRGNSQSIRIPIYVNESKYDLIENEKYCLVGVQRYNDNNSNDEPHYCISFMFHLTLTNDNIKDEELDEEENFLPNLNRYLTEPLYEFLKSGNFIESIASHIYEKIPTNCYVQKILVKKPRSKDMCLFFSIFFHNPINIDNMENWCFRFNNAVNLVNEGLRSNKIQELEQKYREVFGSIWYENDPRWKVDYQEELTDKIPLNTNFEGDLNGN